MNNKEAIEVLETMTAEPEDGQEARLSADELDAVLFAIGFIKTMTDKEAETMKTNAGGEVVLSETEKETILEGMRLLSVYCENLTGCRECPFMKVRAIDDAGNKIRACECKSFMPCCWTIPDKWEKDGEDE